MNKSNTFNAKKLTLALVMFFAFLFGTSQSYAQYCEAGYNETCGEAINAVYFGDINNETDCSGYEDYTWLSTQVTAGNLTIEIYNYDPYPEDQVAVWFDWNQDGVFDESSEQYILDSDGSGKYFYGDIYVPNEALGGTTIMRARITYGETPKPCGDSENGLGEVEDYSIDVIENNMYYASSTSTQITTALRAGTTGNVIVGVQVEMGGSANVLNMTSLTANTNGSTNPSSDISAAHIYYSGTSNSPAGSTLLATINNPNGTMNFDLVQELAGGMNYFWIVYDLTANATIGNVVDAQCTQLVIGGETQIPSVTAPSGSRQIKDALAGTYTVGSGGNYTLLSDAFNDMNAVGIKGNTTFNIVSDISEAGNAVLNAPIEFGGSGYSINVTASAPRTITGYAASSGVIVSNGADNFTIDGTAARFLTIKNNYTSGFSIGVLLSNAAQKNTLKGLNIQGNGSAQFHGIYVNGASNNDLLIDNNLISPNLMTQQSYCIFANGANSNMTITNNNLRFAMRGIVISGAQTNLVITNNNIGDDVAAQSFNFRGIDITNTITTGNISVNRIFNINNNYWGGAAIGINIAAANTNLTITRNNIQNTKFSLNAAGYGAQGINVENGTGTLIANNMIAEVNAPGTTNTTINTQAQPWGIRVANGSDMKLYHNTVSMTETFVDQANPRISAAMIVSAPSAKLDIRNNIFRNEMTSTNTATKAYGLYLVEIPGTIDNNNYYVAGSRAVLGYYNGDLTALSDIQAKTLQDKGSKNVAPQFFGSDNLHLSGTSTGNTNFLVSPISEITTDFDGETRRTANVQMGADEVRPIWSFSPNLTQLPGVKCAYLNYVISFNPVMTFGDGVNRPVTTNLPTYSWYKDANLITGQSEKYLEINYAVAKDRGTYQAMASFLTESAYTATSTILIEEPMQVASQPRNADVCIDANTTLLTVDASGTIDSYQWQQYNTKTSTWDNIQGADAAAYTVNLNELPVYSTSLGLKQAQFRVLLNGPGNCGSAQLISSAATVTAATAVTANTTTMSSSAPCVNSSFSITSNATGTIYGYQWQKWNGTTFANLNIDDFPSAQSKTLSFPKASLANTGDYRVLISGPQSCGQANYASATQRVDVLQGATLVGNPEPRIEICEGTEFSMAVTVDGTVRAYTWQKDGVDLDNTVNPSAHKAYFWVGKSTFENSGVYRCRITVEDCNGLNDIYSEESVLYVNTVTEITRQPEDSKVLFGETALFYFDAHVQGVTKAEDIVVQWYKNGVILNDDKTRVAGARTNLLTIKNISQADLADTYYAVVSGLCGTATTNTVSIKENVVLTVTSNLSNITVCEASNFELEVAAAVSNTSYTINYQWFKDTSPLVDNARISGTNTAKLTVSNMTETDQATYYCRVWVDGIGDFNSDKAVIEMGTAVKALSQSSFNVEVETGKSLNLFVNVTSTTPETYQWKKDDVDIAGATSNTYTVANASTADAGVYSVIVNNACFVTIMPISTVTVSQASTSGIGIDKDAAFTMWNAPNPSDDYTKITVRLDNASEVRIVVSDATGRELGEIHNAYHSAGQFDINFNAASLGLTSGVYNYTMTAKGKQITRQLVIVK